MQQRGGVGWAQQHGISEAYERPPRSGGSAMAGPEVTPPHERGRAAAGGGKLIIHTHTHSTHTHTHIHIHTHSTHTQHTYTYRHTQHTHPTALWLVEYLPCVCDSCVCAHTRARFSAAGH